jgi:hypothetical protein
MIMDRPVRRFLLTWWLCCFLLLFASVVIEQLMFSGMPGGMDVAINALILLGEMARYTVVIVVSGLLISARRFFLVGLLVFLAIQFLVTEYRYSGVEGLGLYGLQLVAEGSVTVWGHVLKAVFPIISLCAALLLVGAKPQSNLES